LHLAKEREQRIDVIAGCRLNEHGHRRTNIAK
jgi:hypothetical protein